MMIAFAEQRPRDSSMTIVMPETIDDTSHAVARGACESSGYDRWPAARYLKLLRLL